MIQSSKSSPTICEDRSTEAKLIPFAMNKNTYIKINKVLRPLAEMPTQVYYDNSLQVIDVLEWALEQVGSAKVWQTSFSMSSEFLSRLNMMKKQGRANVIEHVLILDIKALEKTRKLWKAISMVIPLVYLSKSHAKFMLIEGENGMKVTMLTSQNLTRGNRYESSLITTHAGLFDRLKEQTEFVIKNYSRPFHEIYDEHRDVAEMFAVLKKTMKEIEQL